jgi:perosamine synthetase
MDYDHARTLITPRTKAVCIVLYGGQTVSSIPQFYCDGNIPVVLDCAHACGARQDLSIAPLHCWSFHAVKNLACGDGGMLTMHSRDLYERAKRLRWCGIDTSTYDRANSAVGSYKWEYDVKEIGYKCHMNDITASIGLVQLQKMPDMQKKRIVLVKQYAKGLKDLFIPHATSSLLERVDTDHAWHLYKIRTDRRNELADYLRSKDINTGVHYKPIHLYDCWGKYKPFLPVVEREWQKLLTLPLFVDMTLEQVDYVCSGIKDFYVNNHST